VRAFITTLRERYSNIDILVGEGVAAGCDPWRNFQVSGYARLAAEMKVQLIDLHNTEWLTVEWEFGKLELPRVAFERTYINLPILKPSSACLISGALKNQKGLVHPNIKKQFHRLGLHRQIAALNVVIQPSLTIMDCSRFFGRNFLISGNNCGEIDATACQLLDIAEPEHVSLSRSAQVFAPGYPVRGATDIQRIAARPTVREFKRLGRLRLWSNPQACTMCRYLFHDIQNSLFNPKKLTGKGKLIALSLKGAEIIYGSNPRWQQEYQTVLCIGACTYRLAKEGGYTYIPGCPPSPDDLYNNLP
jgi:hypothetical protein